MSRNLFFPYLLADYPDGSKFGDLLDLTARYADTIEIGIPFTDPVADGPVIAAASSQVLATGFTVNSVFKTLQQKKLTVPVALMSYANPILAYGHTAFLEACSESGVKHLIVPDVPMEESTDWRAMTNEHGISWISFVSLTTSKKRLKQIAQAAQGFVYLLSLKGMTGAVISDFDQVREKAIELKEETDVPVALGFGVKSAEDTFRLREYVDAFIVGSRIIEIVQSNSLKDLEMFYQTFRS